MHDPSGLGLSDADLARMNELAERAGGADALIRADAELRRRNRGERADDPNAIIWPEDAAPAPAPPIAVPPRWFGLGWLLCRR